MFLCMYLCVYVWCSTVSKHRLARRLPRVPPAGGGANECTYCQYILTGLWSRVAQIPWNRIAVAPWIPQHHWARVLSFWRCMYAIGAERCQLLSDCCRQSLHLNLERSTMPLNQWLLFVFWQGKAFFCRASSKANLKYWYLKRAQNLYFV